MLKYVISRQQKLSLKCFIGAVIITTFNINIFFLLLILFLLLLLLLSLFYTDLTNGVDKRDTSIEYQCLFCGIFI